MTGSHWAFILKVTMYLVLQGIGWFLFQFLCIISRSTISDYVWLHSAYGLGYDIRSSGKKADNCCLFTDPLFVVCRAGPCPHVRLLVTDDPSMCTSGRVSKYNSHRWYLLMLSSMHYLLWSRCRRHWGYLHSRGTWRILRAFHTWPYGACLSWDSLKRSTQKSTYI